MKRILYSTVLAIVASALTCCTAYNGKTDENNIDMNANLKLTQEWDKVFPKSDEVNHGKVTFRNRFGITLAADLYIPKGASGKSPAIAVCGPFGAVKEQASGLYA